MLKKTIILIFCVPFFSFGMQVTGDFTINAWNSSDPAVKDLKEYIYKMSGIRLCDGAGLKSIVLKKGGNSSGEGFTFSVSDGKVSISSPGENGLRNGIYYLLDDVWGCRFLAKDFEFIPKHEKLVIDNTSPKIIEPSYLDRGIIAAPGNSAFDKTWARRNKLSAELSGLAYHCNYKYLPPLEYFTKHPEWYPAWKDGRREAKLHWFCWTNQAMLEELGRNIGRAFEKLPDNVFLRMGQDDDSVNCFCEKCQKLVSEYSSPNAPALIGLNSILAKLEKRYPAKKIITFAYLNTAVPPLKNDKLLPLHRNLYLTYVNTGDHMKSHYAGTMASTKLLEKWRPAASHMNVWDWSVNFSFCIAPFPNIKARCEDIRFFKELGFRGFYPQMVDGGDFFRLREWIFARTLWNVNNDIERSEEEFLKLYCGEESGKILFDYLKKLQDKAAKVKSVHNAIYGGKPENIKNVFFAGNDFIEARKVFEDASAKAVYKENVKEIYTQSFAALLYSPERSLERAVLDDGSVWLLPGGDKSLASSSELMADAFAKGARVSEFGDRAWQKSLYMKTVGGKAGYVLETQKIKLEFFPVIDGRVGILDKKTKRHILTLENIFGLNSGNGFKYDGNIITFGVRTNIWWEPRAIEGKSVYTLKNSSFNVSSSVKAVSAKKIFFEKSDLSKTYKYSIGKNIYDAKLKISFNIINPHGLLCFLDSQEVAITGTGVIDAGKAKTITVMDGNANASVPVVALGKNWKNVSVQLSKDGKTLILEAARDKFAVDFEKPCCVGEYAISVLERLEAARLLPVEGLTGRFVNGKLELSWENDGVPCTVFANDIKLSEKPVTDGKFTATLTGKTVVIRVVKVNDRRSEKSLKLETLPGNFAGDDVTKLPKVPWNSDWTLEFSDGSVSSLIIPPAVVKAMNGHRLNIFAAAGTKPRLENVRLNGASVFMKGFVIRANNKSALDPGKNSKFRNNLFEEK